MQKTDGNNNTALALIFLASAAIVIVGLAVIPALGGFQTAQAEPQPKTYCKIDEAGENRACATLTNQDPFLLETNVKKHCREHSSVPGIDFGEGKCTREKDMEN